MSLGDKMNAEMKINSLRSDVTFQFSLSEINTAV